MSRFYDALRQAEKFSDSSPEPAAIADNGAAVAERMNGAKPTAEQAQKDSPLAAPAEELIGEILQVAPPAAAVPTNGALGIPVQAILDKKARTILNSANPQVVERYRIITTKILQRRSGNPFRSVVVTSASPQDGKTVTVVNLGIAFGLMPSFKVLIVDGDLRKGDLSKCLGVGERPGLNNWLEGTAQLEEVVLQSPELPMKFMVRGDSKLSAPELLQSPQFAKKMRKLVEHFDLVLIDSPPASLLADAQLLASACDGVLLVARAFSTTCRGFEELCRNLQQFPMVGTILNGGVGRGSYYRRYHYGY